MNLGKSIAAQQKQRLGRQTVYMRALQESIPSAALQLNGVLRNTRSASPRLADHAEAMSLPRGWLDGASDALVTSLDGIVPRSLVRDSDWFLSALIHPSFLPLTSPGQPQPLRSRDMRRRLRQRYAMPQEILLCGTASLRLVRESASAVNTAAEAQPLASSDRWATTRGVAETLPPTRAPVLTDAALSAFPILHDRERWILFDPRLSEGQDPAHCETPLPVLINAETALCGAIALTCGSEALLAYLDRSLAASLSYDASSSQSDARAQEL